MFDNIPVALAVKVGDEYVLRSIPNIPHSVLPEDLFLNRAWEVSMFDFINWIKRRVFPENREDCKELLQLLGLPRYDQLMIAEVNKACLMEDPYWIRFRPTDSFRTDTVRGCAGYPDLTLEYLQSFGESQ